MRAVPNIHWAALTTPPRVCCMVRWDASSVATRDSICATDDLMSSGAAAALGCADAPCPKERVAGTARQYKKWHAMTVVRTDRNLGIRPRYTAKAGSVANRTAMKESASSRSAQIKLG